MDKLNSYKHTLCNTKDAFQKNNYPVIKNEKLNGSKQEATNFVKKKIYRKDLRLIRHYYLNTLFNDKP